MYSAVFLFAAGMLFNSGCDEIRRSNEVYDGIQQGLSGHVNVSNTRLLFESSAEPTHEWNGNGINLYMEWCDYNGKQIRSRRYGAILIGYNGEVLRFRSVENMIRMLAEANKTTDEYELAGIVDFISAKKIYEPQELMYHISRNLPSPDGSNISALHPDADEGLLFNIGEAYPGTRISWEEVWDLVVSEIF